MSYATGTQSANVHPDRAMLQDGPLLIKASSWQSQSLEGFNASNGWLESFKKVLWICEYQISG